MPTVDMNGRMMHRTELRKDAFDANNTPRIMEHEAGGTADKAEHIEDATFREDDTKEAKDDMFVLNDWSRTGRGSHVDFDRNEVVPLQQGTFLGRGAVGDVHEVMIQGWKLAHKRMVVRRKLHGREMNEIDILKRLPSHEHVIQLVVCDLHTLFDDLEAWNYTGTAHRSTGDRLEMLESSQKDRLQALGYDFPTSNERCNASLLYYNIGCLISAISFLHEQRIRHKDLKPSNILISKNRMWLSDFGSATDFSLLSQSATDNERGSPRYFSPEVAAWKPNGRAADMFSLGCVLLEIVIIHDQGTLHYIQQNRSTDPSFHANLDHIDKWFRGPEGSHSSTWSRRRAHLVREIKSVLAHDPAMRPSAQQVLLEITGYDVSQSITSKNSIFGECCRSSILSVKEQSKARVAHEKNISDLRNELEKYHNALEDLQLEKSKLVAQHEKEVASQKRRMAELLVDMEKARKELEHSQLEKTSRIDEHNRDVMTYEKTVKDLQFRLSDVNKELQNQKLECFKLAVERDLNKTYKEDLDALQTQVHDKNLELEDLKQTFQNEMEEMEFRLQVTIEGGAEYARLTREQREKYDMSSTDGQSSISRSVSASGGPESEDSEREGISSAHAESRTSQSSLVLKEAQSNAARPKPLRFELSSEGPSQVLQNREHIGFDVIDAPANEPKRSLRSRIAKMLEKPA